MLIKLLKMYSKYQMITVVIMIFLINSTSTLNHQSLLLDKNTASDNELVDLILSKGYLPKDNEMPKASIVKKIDNDATFLLSKLSDEELLKLLSDQPKRKEYNLKDIVKVALNKPAKDNKYVLDSLNKIKNKFRGITEPRALDAPEFRLEHKPVQSYGLQAVDPKYVAFQKINSLLLSRQVELSDDLKNEEEDKKKELLFDVLVAQLKTLCCKRSSYAATKPKLQYTPVLNDIFPKQVTEDGTSGTNHRIDFEQVFLIVNDDIKSNDSSEIISVDPESLDSNSSVLLLGPITTPLSDEQLKLVMHRISNELSKPEYIPLLQQLSDGTLSESNVALMKSLLIGADSRRYIKPHRCNHQSKLARIYGGPKWIICTGYINLNTPSLYD